MENALALVVRVRGAGVEHVDVKPRPRHAGAALGLLPREHLVVQERPAHHHFDVGLDL